MKATVIGFDIKKYSGSENVDEMDSKRNVLRTTLQTCIQKYPEIERGFNNIGTPDTGDGCYIVIDSGKFENIISFLEDVKSTLANQNIIRLRAAVHRDTVRETDSMNGQSRTWIGDGVNNCARNLDSEPLKTLIDINVDKNFVYGLSEEFFNELNEDEINNHLFDTFCFKTKDYVSKIHLNVELIANLPPKKELPELIEFTITESLQMFLEKTEFIYPDKSKPNNLSSFFVYPYLLFHKMNKKYESKIDAYELLLDYISKPGKVLILGDDQTGKTSLAKKSFSVLFSSKKYIPVLVTCKKGVPKKYKNLIQDNFSKQYNQKYSDDLGKYIVLILDNFNQWNDTQQKDFISNLGANSKVIIFANSIYNERVEKLNLLSSFEKYEIKTLGHEKRAELINKWISFVDGENSNYKLVDELTQFVDKTLLSGLIPYTPFYVLTVLLAKKEYSENPNDKITSKAKCYEMLVDLQLKYININDQEIPNYRTVFSYIAYQLYKNQKEYFSYDELKNIIVEYKKDYTLNGSPEELIDIFNKSSIFAYEEGFGEYTFSFKYSYYYFLGKYLADNYLREADIKNEVLTLLDSLYEKQNYYISIFVIHHLKDESYFDEICKRAESLYKEYPEAKLIKEEFVELDTEFKDNENLIINSLDNSENNRLSEARRQDEYEANNEEDDVSVAEETKQLYQTIRIVELLGQVVKNNGQIKRTKLMYYYKTGMNIYKRVCTFFLSNFKLYKDDFLQLIKEHLEKQGILSTADAKRQAYSLFANMNFVSVYATIYRISDALSANHLMTELIQPIVEEDPTPMNYCVFIHGLMWYRKELPFDSLKKEFFEFPNEVQFLIKSLLQDYTDKHHLTTAQKQKLASTFKMEIKALEYDTTQ